MDLPLEHLMRYNLATGGLMATLSHSLVVPVGAIKSFGEFGPEYQILGLSPMEDGEQRVRIVLVRTGEETDYGLEAALADPEAR
jgi:hypothetical protein